MIFVDTSALLALLDRRAEQHQEVTAAMVSAVADEVCVSHNYVVVETEALLHRRHGRAAARRLLESIVPLFDIVWATPELHAAAVEAHLADMRRRTSLVDHLSFVVMRERGIERALALDRHFAQAGFAVEP